MLKTYIYYSIMFMISITIPWYIFDYTNEQDMCILYIICIIKKEWIYFITCKLFLLLRLIKSQTLQPIRNHSSLRHAYPHVTGFEFARINFNLHVILDFLLSQKIGRRLNRYKKYNKNKRRLHNKATKNKSRLKFKLLDAKKHVINLSTRHLSDDEYILLSRGLKFIPSLPIKFAKTRYIKRFWWIL